jgi:hypothetical protein
MQYTTADMHGRSINETPRAYSRRLLQRVEPASEMVKTAHIRPPIESELTEMFSVFGAKDCGGVLSLGVPLLRRGLTDLMGLHKHEVDAMLDQFQKNGVAGKYVIGVDEFLAVMLSVVWDEAAKLPVSSTS